MWYNYLFDLLQLLKVEKEVSIKGALVVSISPGGLMLARFKSHERGVMLTDFALEPLPPSVFDNLLIKDTLLVSNMFSKLLKKMYVSSSIVISTLPFNQMRIKKVEMTPDLSPRQQYEEIRGFVRHFFPDIQKNFYVDFSILPQKRKRQRPDQAKMGHANPNERSSVRENQEAIMAACASETVADVVDLFKTHHMVVGCLDVDLYASVRAMSLLDEYQSASNVEFPAVAVIEFDYAKLSLVVMRGEEPIYQNIESFRSQLWDNMGNPSQDDPTIAYSELFARLDRFLQFYYAKNQTHRIASFYLAGLGALLPESLAQFKRRFGNVVKVVDLGERLVIADNVNKSAVLANAPLLLPLVGLGMRTIGN